MNGWVGLVGWPVADGLPTLVVTHQLQVERRTGKVRQSETDVLPLCYATYPSYLPKITSMLTSYVSYVVCSRVQLRVCTTSIWSVLAMTSSTSGSRSGAGTDWPRFRVMWCDPDFGSRDPDSASRDPDFGSRDHAIHKVSVVSLLWC